jgi:hypothetical protein
MKSLRGLLIGHCTFWWHVHITGLMESTMCRKFERKRNPFIIHIASGKLCQGIDYGIFDSLWLKAVRIRMASVTMIPFLALW